MGVYIKGMDMPKEVPATVWICSNGVAIVCDSEKHCVFATEIIELPEGHGRLIDADAFEVVAYKDTEGREKNTFDEGVKWMAEQIDNAPTVIEEE